MVVASTPCREESEAPPHDNEMMGVLRIRRFRDLQLVLAELQALGVQGSPFRV